MSWFQNSEDIQRQGAARLLRALAPSLPGPVDDLLSKLENGADIAGVAGQLGQELGGYVQALQQRFADLDRRALQIMEYNALLEREVQRLRSDSLRLELNSAREEILLLEDGAQRSRKDADALRKALALEQQMYQKETARLQAQIADQQRIIAKQQLQLNALLNPSKG